jgi:hypothetical protein
MTPTEAFLSQLRGVKGRNGSWTARCPAHDDKSPSLAVRETQDGRVLVHCFGGCATEDVLAAVGMDMADLFPADSVIQQADNSTPKLKPSFFASDLLRIINFEALIVAICAYDMAKGKPVSETDLQRLELACERINEATRYANG